LQGGFEPLCKLVNTSARGLFQAICQHFSFLGVGSLLVLDRESFASMKHLSIEASLRHPRET
jgi:hypothetical protein